MLSILLAVPSCSYIVFGTVSSLHPTSFLITIFILVIQVFSQILCTCIRESVDSLCRDGADMPMPPYIGKACNRPNAAFVSLFR